MTQKKSNVEPPKVEKSKVEKNASEIIAERKAKLEKSSSKASASISGKATVPNTAHDTTKDTDKNKQQEKPHERNWALRVLLILIVFLLGAGTTLYFLPILKERLPILAQWVGPDNTANSTANNSQYSEFTTKLSRLESRLAQHENDIDNLRNAAADADPNAPNALLMERLDSLEQAALQTKEDNSKSAQDLSQSARIDMLLSRMSQLEASFVPLSKGLSDAQTARLERSQLAENSTQQSDQLDQIENRLRKVEDYAGRDNNGALLAFRLGELRRKVTSGRDFSPEIDRITDMMAQGTFAANVEIQQALGWLSQHKDGIATRNTLRD
ncbi:MAG: hypothetical protein JKY45_14750 [Emcibacter sp.]|nr:hypothetical protein [Emcibacter sp.]